MDEISRNGTCIFQACPLPEKCLSSETTCVVHCMIIAIMHKFIETLRFFNSLHGYFWLLLQWWKIPPYGAMVHGILMIDQVCCSLVFFIVQNVC